MTRIAPEGQSWVCACCGKHGKDLYAVGDESCLLHSVLVYDESIVTGPDGTVVSAKAAKKEP